MRYLLIAAMVILVWALPAAAEEGQSPDPPPRADRLWVLGELTVPSRYYYRGFVQERNGAIAQPAVKLGLDLWQAQEGPVSRVSAVAGMRNSFHSRQTMAAETGPDIWYESDTLGGVGVQLFERLDTELFYVAITSPNGAFDTIQEINLNMAYSDAGLWPGDFSLNPYLNFKFEVDGSAVGGPEGTLLQMGMEPGFGLFPPETFPLRLSFPAEVGLSLDDYYFLPEPFAGRDNTFGYAQAGVSLSMPLFFIPPGYGQWLMTVGADYIHLGDNLTTFNRGRDHDVMARLTFRVRY